MTVTVPEKSKLVKNFQAFNAHFSIMNLISDQRFSLLMKES